MGTYKYAISGLVTIESEVEVFFFDGRSGESISEPDVVIRETTGQELLADRTDGRVRISIPSSLPTEKTSSTEPVEFTKAVMSAIDWVLQQRGASLVLGGALRTQDGVGVGLFGNCSCGKSTAAFELTSQRGYQLLADDLLVCDGGMVFAFPRYVNLPRDVPLVETWYRSVVPRTDRLRQWDDEIDVPRNLVSNTVPERVELDYAILIGPDGSKVEEATPSEPEAVPTERAVASLSAWNRSNLAGWTSHSIIRESDEDPETVRQNAIREALSGVGCYRLSSSKRTIPQSIANLVDS